MKKAWNDLGQLMGNTDFYIVRPHGLPYVELNLLPSGNNKGLAAIKQTIIDQILHLPFYGKGVPKSWVTARNMVASEKKQNACIPFIQFKNICRNADPSGFRNTIEIEDCAKFLHSIGAILWYSKMNDLKDWVILQPDWLLNAAYKIIDNNDIQASRGTILTNDFESLQNDENYEGKELILKKMLEAFKIAFPKKHRKEDYIIPARLPSMPAEARWKNDIPYLRLEYKFDFMPIGLVNQLSAELSRYIIEDDQVWNNAVNLADEGSRCQVEEDFYNRTIKMKATGKDARALTKLIMNALNDIMEGYKGIIAQVIVPCRCSVCKTRKNPTSFLYDDLVRWAGNREKAKVFCNEGGEALFIDELLFNAGLSNP